MSNDSYTGSVSYTTTKDFGSFTSTLIPYQSHASFIQTYNAVNVDLEATMLAPRSQAEVDVFKNWIADPNISLDKKRIWIRNLIS